MKKQFDEKYQPQDILDFFLGLMIKGNIVFRGYKRQEQIYPGIIRKNEENVKQEFELLGEFEKYGGSYFHANSTIDFVSYAQHYGIPTRLLDFTYNPFIALFFSLYGNGECDDDYYYVAYANVVDNVVFNTLPYQETLFFMTLRTELLTQRTELAFKTIERTFAGDKKIIDEFISLACMNKITLDSEEDLRRKITDKTLLFVSPNQTNSRILAQQGVFMIPYLLDKTFHKDVFERNCSIIRIHRKHRDFLLMCLNSMGYNIFGLMPDLPSICKEIRERFENGEYT